MHARARRPSARARAMLVACIRGTRRAGRPWDSSELLRGLANPDEEDVVRTALASFEQDSDLKLFADKHHSDESVIIDACITEA